MVGPHQLLHSAPNFLFSVSLHELYLIPEFFLAFTAVTLITHCSLVSYSKMYSTSVLAQFSVTSLSILILFLTLVLYLHEGSLAIKHLSLEFTFLVDSLGFLSKILTIMASLICIYLIQDYILEYKINSTEYELLMLYAVLGLAMLIGANDFGTIFLALELQSLSLYILSGFKKNSIYSVESGLKYFILGALSAAYFLLGWSLLYGISGLFILLNFHFFFFNISLDVGKEKVANNTLHKETLCEETPLGFENTINAEVLSELSSNLIYVLIGIHELFCCDSCGSGCRETTPLEKKDSTPVVDQVLKIYDSKKYKIGHKEYDSIHCDFCKKSIENFGVVDKEEINKKERLRFPRTEQNEKKCFFCEKLIENSQRALWEEECKIIIKRKKMLGVYQRGLTPEVYAHYEEFLKEYFNKRTELTPEVFQESLRQGVFTTCYDVDLDEQNVPFCKHIVSRFSQAWEIQGLRSAILTNKIEKTCGDLKESGKTNKTCERLKAGGFLIRISDYTAELRLKAKKLYNGTKITETNESKLAESALTLVLVSFFFKLAVAPFHMWSLDIYEGSLTSSTIFFAVVTKFSVIVILVKICYYGFYSLLKNSLYQYLILGSALSVLVGSIAGLAERKLKSLIAYSSINNVGYVLLALTIGTLNGIKTTLFYLIIYLSSSLAVWSGLIAIQLEKNRYIKKHNKEFGDIAMLRKANPMLTATLQIALFSTAGLPPFIGFLTKMNVFLASIESDIFLVSLITITLSVLSTFYYLRLVKITCFEKMLVGRLYKPMKLKQSNVNTAFSFFLPYQFFKPWLSVFFSYKVVIC